MKIFRKTVLFHVLSFILLHMFIFFLLQSFVLNNVFNIFNNCKICFNGIYHTKK